MTKSTKINFELLNQMLEDELYQNLIDEIKNLLKEELEINNQMRLELLISRALKAISNLKEAHEYNMSALKKAQQLNDLDCLAQIEFNQIMIELRLNNLEKSLSYGKKALLHYKELNNKEKIAQVYAALGVVSHEFNYYDLAKEYYLKALAHKAYLDDNFKLTIMMNTTVISIYEGEYEKVINDCKENILKAHESGNLRLICMGYRTKAVAHYALQQYKEAKLAFKMVVPFQKYLKDYYEQAEWYKLAALLASRFGNLDHAQKFNEKIEKLNDKIINT